MPEKSRWVKIAALEAIPEGLPCLIYCKTGNFQVQSQSPALSDPEMDRANRLLPEFRKNFVASHVLLRHVLAFFTGLPIESLDLGVLHQGKPVLQNHGMHFNLSHCADALAIAVSGHEIGVDIEEKRPDIDFEGMMDYAFSVADRLFCQKQDLPTAFTQIWTLKEAYLKAVGTGLCENLTEIDLTGPNSILKKNGYNSLTFCCPNQEIGSIVSKQDLAGLNFFEWVFQSNP
jgi:phosphopantetheinyl transferase